MAEDKKSGEKTIEMRLAELEDKLARIHITEEELKAYHKVNSLISQGGAMEAQVDPTVSPQVCVVPRQVFRYINRGVITPRINRGINECSCGPCNCDVSGGGGGFGGGFGGFGM
jgi:hypothetical protein